MYNKQLLLHLSLIEGVGPQAIQRIITKITSDVTASDVYRFSAADLRYYYGFTENAAYNIAAGLADQKMLEEELFLIEKHAIQCITIDDEAYPFLLREIYMPPAVIYYKGDGFSPGYKHVAVVGSRESSAYGHAIVSAIVPELIAERVVIVSGGARGVDTLAHEYALKNGGKTIAVLGSGLLQEYPPSNKKLFASMVDRGGLVVSSFPLRAAPLPGNFPARNRIISGLSDACLVVQAAQKSGALITAHYAVEQGRDVFAVPGLISDPLSVGCHELIQQGAKLVISGKDILQEIDSNFIVKKDVQISLPEKTEPKKSSAPAPDQFSDVQRTIMILCKQATSLDDIVQKTGLEMTAVQSVLFDMQLEGFIEQDFTGMWMCTKFF